MKTHITKWGNSYAVRLPRAFAKQVGFQEGTSIEIVAKENHLVLKKLSYSLDDLLQQIRPENLHKEISTGPPMGRELW